MKRKTTTIGTGTAAESLGVNSAKNRLVQIIFIIH
jgi:hypothetical protein